MTLFQVLALLVTLTALFSYLNVRFIRLPTTIGVVLIALLAFGLAGVLLGVREVMHRRWLKTGGDASAYLLLCPNLTLVALAANVLLERADGSQPAAWLLLAGLFVTVPSISFLPAESPSGPSQPAQPWPDVEMNPNEAAVVASRRKTE